MYLFPEKNYTISIDPIQFKIDLVDQVVSTNITYLGISVAIILATSIIFSILMHFKYYLPLQKKLNFHKKSLTILTTKIEEERRANRGKLKGLADKQKTSLLQFKDDVSNLEKQTIEKQLLHEKLIGDLEKDLKIKSTTLETLIKSTNRKVLMLDIYQNWNEHYIWEAKEVPGNAFISLVSCVRSCVSADNGSFLDLCFDSIIDLAPTLSEDDNLGLNFYYKELLKLLDTIQEKNVKGEIKDFDNKKFEKTKEVIMKINLSTSSTPSKTSSTSV